MSAEAGDERRILWEQFVDIYTDSQASFDTSVRAMAAGGVAVTVSLATALKELDLVGVVAVVAFLVSLGANIVSYETARRDMLERLSYLQGNAGSDKGGNEWGNRWTTWTTGLNYAAGLAVLAGGAFLVGFVWTAT